ncbi:MAG: [FeFe] hydrogenase H-cluster maturation GTPase HydF [Selenomonas ruminantium]|uniref:[FeFe] hydrogenase H-cluster maturation GTPase HydF n=1 Tax=Selenomonas ruminantium TaxID=971 RepID=A0A927ZQ55_SELRU|nr:[FeFe] hydrogenase H-cluster maturation GTPase HydF [Selenomonas ruminantium]MBE6086322.1 [FeFe] hydrogenase H-cluster maturation GTPase HydF [Selenomonas ruminantium]
MTLNDTTRGNRLHIGLFGRRNAGKSLLINALTGQSVATVSAVPGTTTDPVYKAMELHGVGPVVFIDTAGFDDEGELGQLRVEKTEQAARETDIALLLFSGLDMAEELKWLAIFRQQKTPVILVVSCTDEREAAGEALIKAVEAATGVCPLQVSAVKKQGLEELRQELIRVLPEDYEQPSITGNLCQAGDLVLLVMPQDIQAPKGRLILPQVQTLRELLDKGCQALCCTTDRLQETLARLKEPPQVIITDSQAFKEVYPLKPQGTLLTSFSVLFAAFKGDMDYFLDGAEKLLQLKESAHVLIAEACTHKPLQEDIGRVKLPRLLRKKIGDGLQIDIVSGKDFPEDLSGFDIIIHCGACMFNRKLVLSRVKACREQGVPMTNYGLAIAALLGILSRVALPDGRKYAKM